MGSAEEMYSREVYDEYIDDAQAFSELASEEQYPAFMVARGYTWAETVEEIEPDEIDFFKTDSIPMLVEFQNPPDYETWSSDGMREWNATASERRTDWFSSIASAVIENLGAFDLLFAALGLFTAFRIGSGGPDESDGVQV